MRATIAALVLCLLVAALAVAGAATGAPAAVGGETAAGPPAASTPVQSVGPPSTVAEPTTATTGTAHPTATGTTTPADTATATTGATDSARASASGLASGDASASSAQADDDGESDEYAPFNGTSPETIEIQVRSDGDARFVVVKEFPAESEPQRAAFEGVAEDFRNEEYDLGEAFFESTVDDVSSEVDRSMDVVGVDREASVSEGTGRLTLSLTWTNFGNVTGEQIEVEDGFYTDDGLWFQSLESGQELTIRAPEGYSVAHSESLVRDNGQTVVWEGPETFEPGDLRTVFDSSTSAWNTWLLVGGVGLLLLLVGGAGLLVFRRRADEPLADPTESDDEPVPTATGDGGETADAGAGDAAAAAGAATAAAGASRDDGGESAPTAEAGGATTGESEAVDTELLSDEERVERLLEQNGGRMKQARIVEETGWSNAKVSQLLSKMAEEDRVDKLRLGRENLISLPDEDVTATE